VLNKTDSRTLTGIKYFYLIIFFVLLAGFFHPLISETSLVPVIFGILVLFVGLAGTVLVYKTTIVENRRGIYLSSGFGLILISLAFILLLTERF